MKKISLCKLCLAFFICVLVSICSATLVFADSNEMTYKNGKWYEGNPYEQLGPEITNLPASLSDESILFIEEDPSAALAALNIGDKIVRVNTLFFETSPKDSDCVIPDKLKTETIRLCYECGENDTVYQYTGDLLYLQRWGGSIKVKGDVTNLELGDRSESGSRYGNVIIDGDITNAEFIRKTTEINPSEYTDQYGEDDVKESISQSSNKNFYLGNFSIKGKIDTLKIFEPYYDRDSLMLFVCKEKVKNLVKDSVITIISEGNLQNVPDTNITKYSTDEWIQRAYENRTYEYQCYYNDDAYNWNKIIYIDGEWAGDVDVEMDENLPKGGIPENSDITFYGTDDKGLTITGNMNKVVFICGKANINGNVKMLDVQNLVKFWNYPGCIDASVSGDVDNLSITGASKEVSINIGGKLKFGENATNYKDENYEYVKFSKDAGVANDVMVEGTLNSDIMLITESDEGELSYAVDTSMENLEKASGITENNRVSGEGDNAEVLHAGTTAILDELSNSEKSQVENAQGVGNDYYSTGAAIEIEVSTYKMSNNGGSEGDIITDTNSNEIDYSVKIPDYNESGDYEIVRIHEKTDGSTSYNLIESEVDNGVIQFGSDKFSKFAILTNAKRITKGITALLSKKTYVYDGNNKTPAITVKYNNKKLSYNKDYTYKWNTSKRKSVGTYSVTINYKGKYAGSKKLTFVINPKGTSIKKLTKAKKAFTVKWAKQSANMSTSKITGYQIQYSRSSKFASGNKTVKVKGYSNTSKKIGKLKPKKKYYVRVRTYKTVSGKTYYSGWSSKKYVTTQ